MVQLEISKDGQTQSLTRRTFLQRTLASGASTALLASCALSTKTSTTLNWICEGGYKADITSFQMLAQMYNALNKDQTTINVQSGTAHDVLQQMLTSPDLVTRAQYDILSLDVVWISEFASKGWIVST